MLQRLPSKFNTRILGNNKALFTATKSKTKLIQFIGQSNGDSCGFIFIKGVVVPAVAVFFG